ncbi:MAG: pentapeptide repeat-containing protein [Parachlamydiales bacterium]|nr:pentapeptide repeat-containing protein [Parachlamydiales bacterium]
MQIFYIYKIINLFILISFSPIFSMNFLMEKSEEFDSCRIFFWGEDLRLKNLQFTNFTSCVLQGTLLSHSNCDEASFRSANLEGAIAIKTSFRYASFRWAHLENADFTNADFYHAYFYGSDLSGAIVEGANFEKATGLTNEQKKYLRAHGAKNVPKDLTSEEFEEETKRIEEELKSPLLDWIDNIIDRIFCCRKKHKKHTE